MHQLLHDHVGGGKTLFQLAAFADGPGEIGLHRVHAFIHIMPVEAKPRFQPQAVARAQPDGQHFFLDQKGAGDAIGIGAFNADLEAVLAGVAAAADDGGRARDGGAYHLHEGEI